MASEILNPGVLSPESEETETRGILNPGVLSPESEETETRGILNP
jgi:hypothetical protein